MAVLNTNYAESYVQNYARPITFTPTAGSDLVLLVQHPGGATISSVTDNSAGTPAWTLDRAFAGSTEFAAFSIYRRANISGAPTTININSSLEEWKYTWLIEDDALADSGQPAQSLAEELSSEVFNTAIPLNVDPLLSNSLIVMFVKVLYNPGDITGVPANWARIRTGSVRHDVVYNTSNVGTANNVLNFTLAAADSMGHISTEFERGAGGPVGTPSGRKSPARPTNIGRLFGGGVFREATKQLKSGLLVPAWV